MSIDLSRLPTYGLRQLAQSPGIKLYGECIPVMAGESPQHQRPLIRCNARTRKR